MTVIINFFKAVIRFAQDILAIIGRGLKAIISNLTLLIVAAVLMFVFYFLFYIAKQQAQD